MMSNFSQGCGHIVLASFGNLEVFDGNKWWRATSFKFAACVGGLSAMMPHTMFAITSLLHLHHVVLFVVSN